MSTSTDAERMNALEKKIAELASLIHYQDSMRVKIEKNIGVIDQQLMKTDAGLHRIQAQLSKPAPVSGRAPGTRPAKPRAQKSVRPTAKKSPKRTAKKRVAKRVAASAKSRKR